MMKTTPPMKKDQAVYAGAGVRESSDEDEEEDVFAHGGR